MIHGFHKSHTADLEQIICILAAAFKALDHAQNKPQVAFDVLLPRLFIPGLDPFKKFCLLLLLQ